MLKHDLWKLIFRNDCENSPLWDISPSETDFNPIKLTGTGFCLEANIGQCLTNVQIQISDLFFQDREEVFINPCSGGDEQRFLFNNVGQVILELNRGTFFFSSSLSSISSFMLILPINLNLKNN